MRALQNESDEICSFAISLSTGGSTSLCTRALSKVCEDKEDKLILSFFVFKYLRHNG